MTIADTYRRTRDDAAEQPQIRAAMRATAATNERLRAGCATRPTAKSDAPCDDCGGTGRYLGGLLAIGGDTCRACGGTGAITHGTDSPSKTKCPGCGAVLAADGTCPNGTTGRPVLSSGLSATEAARLGARLPAGTVCVSFWGAK